MKEDSKLSKETAKKEEIKKNFSFSQLLINSHNLRVYTAKNKTFQNLSTNRAS